MNRLKMGMQIEEIYDAMMSGFESNEDVFVILTKIFSTAIEEFPNNNPLDFFVYLDLLEIYEDDIKTLYDLCGQDFVVMLKVLIVVAGVHKDAQELFQKRVREKQLVPGPLAAMYDRREAA